MDGWEKEGNGKSRPVEDVYTSRILRKDASGKFRLILIPEVVSWTDALTGSGHHGLPGPSKAGRAARPSQKIVS